jgi:hypothetical protein
MIANTSRRLASSPLLAALFAASLAASAVAQDRVPQFGLGVAQPDGTGQNVILWLGGDAPHGTYIAPNYSFWGFGDTFLGDPRVSGRHIPNPGNSSLSDIVGNTIAIGQTNSSINNGNFTPYYFYSGTIANKKGFFPEPAPGYRFQILGSMMVGGKLFVFLFTRYVAPGSTDTNGQFLGTFIARVNNPTALPPNWSIDYLPVYTTPAGTSCPLQLGYNLLLSFDGQYLFAYGNYQGTSPPRTIVLAFSTSTLLSTPGGTFVPQSGIQHLEAGPNGQPFWQAGINTDGNYFDTQIDPIFFSLRYNATANLWQLVGIKGFSAGPGNNAPANYQVGPTVYMNNSPFGPFRTGSNYQGLFYAFGEFAANYPDTGTFPSNRYCYCAREWVDPSLSNDETIVFTYTYSSNLSDQLSDPNTYQTHQAAAPNPYFSINKAVKLAPTVGRSKGAKSSTPASDPFSAPGVPKPLPFPVKVDHPVPQQLPWATNLGTATGTGTSLKVK